jgi:hypothetical protein
MVAAYPTPGRTATLTGSCTPIDWGRLVTCNVQFILYGPDGETVNGVPVTFRTAGGWGGAVFPVSSRTGTAGPGEADATLFPSGSDCGSSTTVVATANGVTARTQITVACPTGATAPGLQLIISLLQLLLGHTHF